MKKTILFDIDGTLLHAHSAGSSVIRDILHEQFDTEMIPSNELKLGGRTDKGILTELFQKTGIPIEDSSFTKFSEAYIPALKQNLQSNTPKVLPGVSNLLPKLASDQRIALGLITGNMKRGAVVKLKACGLFHFFHFGGFGDDHCDRNLVAADAVSSAKHFLGREFDPHNIVVIGDTVHDITCARSIGATSVGVLTGAGNVDELKEVKADHIFEDLTQADDLLFSPSAKSQDTFF